MRAEEVHSSRVIDILDDEGTVNLDERETTWRKEGWSGRYTPDLNTGLTGDRRPAGAGSASARTGSVTSEREERIPIAEEHFNVGKREVNQGRVRVRSYVVERPVHEQVSLRDENVSVDRRPVDRPLTGNEDGFRERTIEAQGKREEAVVNKQARVTEEVVVKKDANQRTETVSDKVRDLRINLSKRSVRTCWPH